MNGSERFPIRRSKNYEKTHKKLVRDRYRKNRQGIEEFIKEIGRLIILLENNPCLPPSIGHLEPFPQGTNLPPEYEFWKLYFKLPQLRGAAEQGRIMYLLDTFRKEVLLVWIYTHAEFEKRPPDKTLKQVLQEIIELKTDSECTNNSEIEDERENKDDIERITDEYRTRDRQQIIGINGINSLAITIWLKRKIDNQFQFITLKLKKEKKSNA